MDLGSIFDLGVLRPFAADHILAIPGTTMAGRQRHQGPRTSTPSPSRCRSTDLTADGRPRRTSPSERSVIGVWTSACRQTVSATSTPPPAAPCPRRALGAGLAARATPSSTRSSSPWPRRTLEHAGPAPRRPVRPVREQPRAGRAAAGAVPGRRSPTWPPTSRRYPATGPTSSPSSSPASRPGSSRASRTSPPGHGAGRHAAPEHGHPAGSTRPRPAISGSSGGDLAGFPNGRRVFDDVVTIEFQAIAGLPLPLVDPKFTPDAVVKSVTDGVGPYPPAFQSSFPYLGNPYDGFDHPPARPAK